MCSSGRSSRLRRVSRCAPSGRNLTAGAARPAGQSDGSSRSGDVEGAAGLRLAIFTDTYSPQVNGVARTLERLAQAIEKRGGAVRIVTVADPEADECASVQRWPSIPFWAYPQLRIAAPSRTKALDVIADWKPTLVHATTEFGIGLAGVFAAREAGVPLVTSYHTHFKAYLEFYKLSFLDPIAWPYIRWFHNRGVRTFAPSAMVARELEDIGVENMRVWSRGVDASRFSPSFRTSAMRARLGVVREDQVLVVYVGRLARYARAQSAEVEGLYLSPVSADSVAYTTSVVRDIARRYDIDGVHFDYIRYPDVHPFYGYTDENLERFRKANKLTSFEESDKRWKKN